MKHRETRPKRPTRPTLAALLLLASLAACSSDSGDDTQSAADAGSTDSASPADGGGERWQRPELPDWGALSWCEGDTAHLYVTPEESAARAEPELEMWPDPLLTRVDDASPTGIRIDASTQRAPWVESTAEILKRNFADMAVLSGFGTNGGVLFRFSAPLGALPDDGAHGTQTPVIQLLDLSTDPPTRVPYRLRQLDEGRDLIIEPLRPLRAGALHAAVMTTDLLAADGDCIAPSALDRTLMTGEDAATGTPLSAGPDDNDPATTMLRAHIDTAAMLNATGLRPDGISALTVFRTHDDLQVLDDVLDDIAGRTFTWAKAPECVDVVGKPYRLCETSFVAQDYRDGRAILTTDTASSWALPVSIYLPRPDAVTGGASGPWPTVVYGHGLGSKRGEAGQLATQLAPEGFAVVAADALVHGDHPTAEGINGAASALEFLGLDLGALEIDALKMRGHFNQTIVDRMQLVELLRQVPDIDGDGSDELDPSRLAYHGISLGGMMGVGLLAMRDELQAGVLSVAGGSLLTFATDNEQVEPFKPVIYNLIGSELLFERMLTVAQALIDAADPATFAPYVLHHRRRAGAEAPDLLVPLSIWDDTVPPAAGRALSRALAAPLVEPVSMPVATLPIAATGVVDANVQTAPDAEPATAGVFQFDRVTHGSGGPQLATHGSTPHSNEGRAQYLHFWRAWRDEGRAQIIDPFEALQTPALPDALRPMP